jgi:hypothetical protein
MKLASMLTAVGAIAAIGCSIPPYHSAYMKPAPNPLVPGEGQAVVVFVNPSNYFPAAGSLVLDEEKNFVADVDPRSHAAIAIPAGRHEFFVLGHDTFDEKPTPFFQEAAGTLHVELSAGKTYYVEVSAKRYGFQLFAVKPNQKNWALYRSWLDTTVSLAPNPVGQDSVGKSKDVGDRVDKGEAEFRAFKGDELDKRTLAPGDAVSL